MESYDVVILGAGFSGLIAGNILSNNGYQVCILEKNSKTGGYVLNFERKGFRFDPTIHFINGCGPNGMMSELLSLFEAQDKIEFIKLKELIHWVDIEGNFEFHDPIPLIRHVKALVDRFPHEKKGIENFYAKYAAVVKWMMEWFTHS